MILPLDAGLQHVHNDKKLSKTLGVKVYHTALFISCCLLAFVEAAVLQNPPRQVHAQCLLCLLMPWCSALHA